MAKLSIFGLEYKYSKKKTFTFSRIFFALYIMYFGLSLWKDSNNENGGMKMFKQGCEKTFGVEKWNCSDSVYSLVTKLLTLTFILSGFILIISGDKKSHKFGSFIGFVGMTIYLIIFNPLLKQYQNS